MLVLDFLFHDWGTIAMCLPPLQYTSFHVYNCMFLLITFLQIKGLKTSLTNFLATEEIK